MSKASYERVEGEESHKAFKDENKLRLRKPVVSSTSDAAQEHVYIVFSNEISIEQGIETIENEVLSGDVLRVARFDVRGHAAVAIVSSSQIHDIEDLPIVKKVRVIEPDHQSFGKTAPVTSYTAK